MIAIQIADFFILKQNKATRPFNIQNLIIWIIGFCLYRLLMRVDVFVGNTLPDMLITIIICVVVSKIRSKTKKWVDKIKRCVIVGCANINNYEYIKSCLQNDDFIVFCDNVLNHLDALQVKSGLIVGDYNPNLDVETIVPPCAKGDTDTIFAVKEVLKRGYDDFFADLYSRFKAWSHLVMYHSSSPWLRLVGKSKLLTITQKGKSSQKNLPISAIPLRSFHLSIYPV